MGSDHTTALGDFLRSRRGRLGPAEAGLEAGTGTRRVPGLRREEVALLAGVSPDYYTRLEQNRHPQVSAAVLDAIARALRLDEVEREYLHGLVRTNNIGSGGRGRPGAVPRVRSAVHQMLDVLGETSPVLVVNHRRDVLSANRLARALLTDFDARPYRERNLARFVLLDPAARELYGDWEEVARTFVAVLRLASGTRPEDRLLNELVGELCVKVPEFSGWWDTHRVRQCAYGEQRVRHPVVGDLTLRHETLVLPSDPGQELCLYTAEPGSASAESLRLLADWTAPGAGASSGPVEPAERTKPA
ncbi:helix-turn-helix transcriptional regulator [Streptomyces sp. NPDC004539]|uniref:helix-turn-helix transcriptional regulator n=1 Tax=Streptomyces sp. NPDC004539 TaxID=3154280 RepID=UPI0033B5AA52